MFPFYRSAVPLDCVIIPRHAYTGDDDEIEVLHKVVNSLQAAYCGVNLLCAKSVMTFCFSQLRH